MTDFQEPELLTDIPYNNLDLFVKQEEWGIERKRDGHRCLVKLDKTDNSYVARSRTLKPTRLPKEVIAKLQNTIWPDSYTEEDIIFDGELIWLDENRKDHRTKVQAGKNAVPCYAIWTIQGPGTYYERKKILLEFANLNSWIAGEAVEYQALIVEQKSKETFVQRGKIEGWEGYVFKLLDGKYIPGRSKEALRWKFRVTEDYIVIGYTKSDKAKNPFRALVLARYDKNGKLIPRGQCGGGFPDKSIDTEKATRTDIYQKYLENKPVWNTLGKKDKKGKMQYNYVNAKRINKKHSFTDKNWGKSYNTIQFLKEEDWFVVEIQSQKHTENGIPFMPQFVRLRQDKKPRDCKEL